MADSAEVKKLKEQLAAANTKASNAEKAAAAANSRADKAEKAQADAEKTAENAVAARKSAEAVAKEAKDSSSDKDKIVEGSFKAEVADKAGKKSTKTFRFVKGRLQTRLTNGKIVDSAELIKLAAIEEGKEGYDAIYAETLQKLVTKGYSGIEEVK